MRKLIGCLAFVLSVCHAEEDFHLPSSMTFSLGGDSAGSKNSSVDLTYTFDYGGQFFLGFNSSKLKDASDGDDLGLGGGHLGYSTDPLQFFSASLEAANWQMSDDIAASSLNFRISFAPEDWLIQMAAGAEVLEFSHLPVLIFKDGKSKVRDTSLQLVVGHTFNNQWSSSFSYAHHFYDKDPHDYTEGLRVLRMPSAVLLTATGLVKSDASIGANYTFDSCNLGLLAGVSRSALDELRTRRLEFNLNYDFNGTWSAGSLIGIAKPEKSTTDASETSYGLFSLTFNWN